MPLQASAVGSVYPPRDVVLSKRDLLSFAAGLDLPWSEALDDARPGGMTGFPTYCASLEFNAFRPSAEGGANPVGATAEEQHRGVHVGQDSVFHRPLRPGSRLRTVGTIAAAADTRAGAVFLLKAQTSDLDTGEPVVTSWISQLYRGLPLDGPPREAEAPPAPPALRTEAPEETIQAPVSRAWPHVYAECAGIWNPIHSEREVALAAGLPDIILQGTATWGLAAREIVVRHGGGDPTRLRRLATRFAGMVFPGDVLSIQLFRRQGHALAFAVVNQHGAPVLKNGVAVLA